MELFLASYVTNPVDRAALGATPMVMMPIAGDLPALPIGRTRFVAGSNGIFIEARSRAMHARVAISESLSLPFGSVDSFVRFAGGLIPASIIEQSRREARLANPREWAGLVWWDGDHGEYRLWTPAPDRVDAGIGRISYADTEIDPLDVAIDMHSHGSMESFFSSTDDADDRAFFGPLTCSAVLGRCGDGQLMTDVARLVINSRLLSLDWRPWRDS